jgi:DNA repair exonuclease SbcCD ATPase subunit
LELQNALQEKQNVSKLVQEWNEKAQKLEQMQSVLKAKSLQHRKKTGEEGGGQTEETEKVALVGAPELNVEKIVEEWTEYALLIETLEKKLKDKEEEVERTKIELQQRAAESEQTVERLQFDLKEVEKQKETQLELAQHVEDNNKELEELRVEIKVKDAQLGSKRDQEEQLNDVTIIIEKLQRELAEKTTELHIQQVRVEEIKVDLQIVEQLKTDLKEKEDELERLRLVEIQRTRDSMQIEAMQGEIDEKINRIQRLELEIVKQGNVVMVAQGELTEVKLQLNAKVMEHETAISELKTIKSEKSEANPSVCIQILSLLFYFILFSLSHFLIRLQVDHLSQQLSRNTEAYAKLEDELRLIKAKLEESEKELENERSLRPSADVVVVRYERFHPSLYPLALPFP